MKNAMYKKYFENLNVQKISARERDEDRIKRVVKLSSANMIKITFNEKLIRIYFKATGLIHVLNPK